MRTTATMPRTTSRVPGSRTYLTCLLFLIGAFASPGTADGQGSPLSDHTRFMYAGVKLLLVRSAEKMPEEHYGFRPTESVRTFGEIIGHVTDWQYRYCSTVLGEKNPRPVIDRTKASKTELVATLKEAVAYCDRAYDGLSDSTAVQLVKLGMDMPKLGVLNINNIHSTEHYGNLVTYLRMKNIVPPSSEPGFTVQPPKR